MVLLDAWPERLNLLRKRLEWADVQAAATDVARRITRDCTPVALITPGLTGATFANLLVEGLPGQPPVFVGTSTWKDATHGTVVAGDSFEFETNKWLVTVPRAPLLYAGGTLLIVDAFVMSGDFLEKLRTRLVEEGVDPARIKSASIAVTKVAIKNKKAPDYYWWEAADDDFYFPWGKAR